MYEKGQNLLARRYSLLIGIRPLTNVTVALFFVLPSAIIHLHTPVSSAGYFLGESHGIARSLTWILQVYSITCADAMAEYTAKKAQRGSPESSLEEAEKVIVFI